MANEFPYGPSLLLGRQIRSVEIGESTLTFNLDDGSQVAWDVEGDCCSYSAFTDVRLNAVLGKTITSVAQIESMVDGRLDPANLSTQVMHQEEMEIYGVEIRADGAEGLVVHRNWSNGYYGGALRERRVSSPHGE